MSTVSTLPNNKCLVSVKGAPETIKTMLEVVPSDYDETYKYYTRRGSRVLALGWKELQGMNTDKVSRWRRQPEDSKLMLKWRRSTTFRGRRQRVA